MDRKQLEGLITAEGQAVAEQHRRDRERQERAARVQAAADEIKNRADSVVGSYREFVMALAPDEVSAPPDPNDFYDKRRHADALKQPAQVEINLGTYKDPELGAGTAKATVALMGAPGSDLAYTPYGYLDHAYGVNILFNFIGSDQPYPREVSLGSETFDARQVMNDVYNSQGVVRDAALAEAGEAVATMEATAGRTMQYLIECASDAALNEELAARLTAWPSAS